MPDTSVKLQDITPVKSTFDSDDQLLLIGPEGEARISKEDFLDAMPDDAITLIGDITTTGIEGDTVAKQLGALENSKAPAITETTESSAIANFTDGADNMVMHNVVAEINPVQSGSGDPSPDNIRPISGWTGCNVTRVGKNLLPNNFYGGIAYNASAGTTLTPTLLDDVIQNGNTYTKTVTSWGSVSMISEPLPIGNYKVNIAVSATSTRSTLYVLDDNFKVTRKIANSSTPIQWTNAITLSSGEKYIAVYLGSSSAGTVSYTEPQIEFGSTATAYEEYIEPTTLTVDWTTEAGTVYGGTIDVATGLLTVTHALFDMGDASAFTADPNRPGVFYFTIPGRLPVSPINGPSDISACSAYKAYNVDVTTNIDNYISGYLSYGGANVFFRDTSMAGYTSAQVKAAVSGYILAYKLATSQTYQLSGQQLATLLGTNNVWADTGNVSVTYPADTKMFIEKLTMPTEDDLVANQAITSGQYFMIGNSLYLALANIASGAQITIGTNAQRVSLADALNTINS